MRCFTVLVHGRIERTPPVASPFADAEPLPRGFYSTRVVIARSGEVARQKAFAKTQAELQRSPWKAVRGVTISFDAEEVRSCGLAALLRRTSGFTFYAED